MYFLYNLIVLCASAVLRLLAMFSPKLSLFVAGRQGVENLLNQKISKTDRVIWVHAASLGEYEQGLPVMEDISQKYPTYKLVLTFFSPSGYEVKKHTTSADIVCYLPLDTKKNADLFLKWVHPEVAIFIKYEIWPNYLRALHQRNIPTLLVSALFNNRQVFFKWYGGLMRKSLAYFSHIFVQNLNSQTLLASIGITEVTIAGDTRFDRVLNISNKDNSLDFMKHFARDKFCVVAGSTWAEDEIILTDYINNTEHPIQFVIAPHTIKPNHIEALKASITKPVLCYSELGNAHAIHPVVLIVDTIGLLTKVYSYADVAYVGGGFATGLHNTLEPAVFGIPVIIGPDYEGFAEAESLVKRKGIISIETYQGFESTLNRYVEDDTFRLETGKINSDFIAQNHGATLKIMNKLHSILGETS